MGHPVGTPVLAKLPTGDPRTNPLSTKTRSTAYLVGETAWVMVSSISTPVALADITDVKTGPKFPVQMTTAFYDEKHIKAFQEAVAAINAEGIDLNVEQVEKEVGDSGWITVSASSANRLFHLGARMGKWLAEEKGGLES